MSKEMLVLNVLNALEELSYYESKSEDDLLILNYKDMRFYLTDVNREIAKELIKELQ
jgi:hypothetical protein